MKKTILFISIICFAITSSSFAQKKGKPFNGSIIFSITYSGDIDAATIAQQPKDLTMKILGSKTRTEISYGPASIISISNGESKTSITLIDMMGQKYAMKKKTEDIDKEISEAKYEIKYNDSTKTIAGFVCKRAIVSIKAKDEETATLIPVWYSDEFGGSEMNYGGQFHGLNGLGLEYEIVTKGIKTVFTVKEVKKGKISDTDFLIPSDFKEISKEEMQKMFSGGSDDE